MLGQTGDQSFALGGPVGSALLKLDDVPACLLAGQHMDGIDAVQHLLSGVAYEAAQLFQERGQGVSRCGDGVGHAGP